MFYYIILIGVLCALWVLYRREHFYNEPNYTPACGAHWLAERRAECVGETSGRMPSIDHNIITTWQPCRKIGIPPPILP